MSDATNPNDLADAPHLLRARPVSVIERIATAEELASVVRHDVRNKLGSVRNAAFFIERKLQRENLLQDDPRTQEFLKLIATELDRANELLDDGFTFTRLHPRAVGDQTLAGALTQVLSALPEALRERVTVDVGEEARVHADAEELHLLLSCLLDNALEASPASAVRVRAEAGSRHTSQAAKAIDA